MRRFAAAIAALCLLAGGAMAQGYEASPRHSGLYAGVGVGYTSAALQAQGGPDWATDGAAVSILAGFGHVMQPNGLYLGFEIDGSLRDVKWSANDAGAAATASNRWIGTGRIRVGQALGPVLFYGTGGVAITDQVVKVAGLGEASDLRVGWVAGLGIEAAFTRTMTLRLEGLHHDFSQKAVTIGGISERIGSGDNVIRAAVTFKLY